jgi:hypothetical protein
MSKTVVVQCYDCGIFTDWNGHRPKFPQCAECETECDDKPAETETEECNE